MQILEPVTTAQREKFMDVLRGFAILGIFIANLAGFSFYRENAQLSAGMLLPALDHQMKFIHHLFIEGKFYSIFSLLFGWGIALQLKRAEVKEVNAIPIIKRRLYFMLLLGGIHLLLWSGDIVFFYALLGFVLLPLRKCSNKQLLITGSVLILSPIILYAAKMKWQFLLAPSDFLFGIGDQLDRYITGVTSDETYYKYIQTASWWDIIKGNIAGFFFRYGHLIFISRISKVLGMFLIGFVLGRTDFYKNIKSNKKIVYLVVALGLLIGIPANYMLAHYMELYDADYYQLKINGLYQTIAYALGVAPLCLAYVGIFMLMFQHSTGKKVLSLLAPVGKMAFSNYILHTLIGQIVFQHAGFGLMGKVGPVYYTIFAFIVFGFQIVTSTIWLTYFNYGPLEWLWRSATYKKWQVMKKQVA